MKFFRLNDGGVINLDHIVAITFPMDAFGRIRLFMTNGQSITLTDQESDRLVLIVDESEPAQLDLPFTSTPFNEGDE